MLCILCLLVVVYVIWNVPSSTFAVILQVLSEMVLKQSLALDSAPQNPIASTQFDFTN